jgi:mannose-6-phosphate isomerase-like protein (cupin superfamily)
MSEPQDYPYATFLDVRFGPLSVVDVPGLIAQVAHPWFNQTLCRVNDAVIRLGVLQGEYHWHRHEKDDEFFFVLEGHFLIDLEDRTVELKPFEGFVVPKGTLHRTRAQQRCVILMAETSSIVPTGD